MLRQTEQIFPLRKPVIYLYPTKQETVSVKLDFSGQLTCTYPDYKNGWNVIAAPDGTLTNLDDNKQYSCLFWEGVSNEAKWDLSQGFVVAGEDTKDFLQEKLAFLGLTPKEYNEFIVYWLPVMQNNKFNLVTFAGREYEDIAPMQITPNPDSVLRVFMVFKSLDSFTEVQPQKLKSFERKGFSVVEWGGTELK
ncbi:MAG: hypothetical protein CVU90_10130 [Firmicutes bacterium HGW-Firmicutes-15]|nr:MAG: hypothetical protein CVU90_10130 [Firmicutes bacterium HGW-Firmicutes-15]